MAHSAPACPANFPIPVDLFASKKYPGLTRGDIGFADSSGNIVFLVNRSPPDEKSLLDSAGNPLISIHHYHDGSWQGFKGSGGNQKELIFNVKRTVNKFSRTELEVFLVGENKGESTFDFKVKGSPFQKSCTIYRGDSIVAQTSLMYKLSQIYVRRNRFRLTIFPGSIIDHDVIVALVVIFLDGRK